MRRSANKMPLSTILLALSLAQLSSSKAQQNSANIPFYSLIFSEKFPPTMGKFDCKLLIFWQTWLISRRVISRSSRHQDKWNKLQEERISSKCFHSCEEQGSSKDWGDRSGNSLNFWTNDGDWKKLEDGLFWL